MIWKPRTVNSRLKKKQGIWEHFLCGFILRLSTQSSYSVVEGKYPIMSNSASVNSSRMEPIGTKGSNHSHSNKNIGILPPGILTNSSWHIRNLFHAIQHVSKLWQAHLSHQISVLLCYHFVRFHAIIGQTKGPKEGKFAASSAATLGRPWRPAAASLAKNLLGRGWKSGKIHRE